MPEVNVISPNGERGPIPVERYAEAMRDSMATFGKPLRPATPDDIAMLAAHSTDAYAPSVADSAGRGALQGVTFGFGDELAAGAGALVDPKGGDYADRLERERAMNTEAGEANPATYLGANVIGSIPTTVAGTAALRGALGAARGVAPLTALAQATGRALPALERVAAPVVTKGASVAAPYFAALEEATPTMLRRILGIVGPGGLQGAVQGAGMSEAPDAAGVATDTAIGTGIGGALGVATHGANALASKVIDPRLATALGPLERLMTTTTKQGGAVAPVPRELATTLGGVMGGTAGASAYGAPGAAGGSVVGAGLGRALAHRAAASGIRKIDESLARGALASGLEARGAAQGAEMLAARQALTPRVETLHDPAFQAQTPGIQEHWAPYEYAEPVDPLDAPAPDLARDPRAYASRPTAAPPDKAVGDEALGGVLRGVEQELGLTPALAPTRRVEPLVSPTEARGPELVPGGGEAPKGPGVSPRGIQALHAERLATVEPPGRPVSPTPPEPAGKGWEPTPSKDLPVTPQDVDALRMMQSMDQPSERARTQALERMGLEAQIRQLMGLPVEAPPTTSTPFPPSETVAQRAHEYRGLMQPSYAGEGLRAGETMDQGVGRMLSEGLTDAQIARRLDTTLPFVRKAMKRVRWTKPLPEGAPPERPAQWDKPAPEEGEWQRPFPTGKVSAAEGGAKPSKSPKYVFHTTSASLLDRIAKGGLRPGRSQTFGGGYAANATGRVMFADTPVSAKSWARHIEDQFVHLYDDEAAHVAMVVRAPKSAVGRVKVDALGTKDIGSAVSGGQTVAPEALEVFTTSGWRPIGQVQPGDFATPASEADWLAPVKK